MKRKPSKNALPKEPKECTTSFDNLFPSAANDGTSGASASFSFKGQPLWPFSPASDLLHQQVAHPQDQPLTVILSFIFVHVKRGGPDMMSDLVSIAPLCWDRDKFRVAFLDWLDKLGKLEINDSTAALELFDTMHGFEHTKSGKEKRQRRSR